MNNTLLQLPYEIVDVTATTPFFFRNGQVFKSKDQFGIYLCTKGHIEASMNGKKYDVKATFFMVGDNVRKHPDEFRLIVENGHRLGNHTFNHIGGFRWKNKDYLENADKADRLIHTNLFRPPHGWMRWGQYYVLSKRYRVVMWDLVTRDYSKWVDADGVYRNIRRYARNGSIITFHDSLKSIEKLHTALPRSIEWLKAHGYEFRVFE